MSPSRFLALGLFACTVPAFSDVMYTYTGPNFTTVYGSYTTSDRVTGSITLASPLAPSQIVTMIPILSFSFTDGVQTITNTTPNLLEVQDDFTTNASGAITAADVVLVTGTTFPEYGIGLGIESTNGSSPSGEGYSPNWIVGTWSGPETVTPAAATPEPSSFALLATGLAGAAGVIRRRFTT